MLSGSPLVGLTLEEARLRNTSGAHVLAIERAGRFSIDVLKPTAKTRIEEGDVFLVDLFAPDPNIDRLQHDLGLQPTARSGRYFADRAQQLGMVEVILPEGSGLIGKSILGAEFRPRYGVTVVGFRRGRTATTTGFMDQTLKVGDTLLLFGF